jgi:hypothetical protein
MRWAFLARTGTALLVAGCALVAIARGDDAKKAGKPVVLDFDKDEVGKLPAGFTSALTGGGGDVKWTVVEDKTAPSGGKALAQTSTDDTDYRFPLCVYEKLTAKDVSVSVRFKPIAGKVDQGAGIVVRYQDKDNYYVTRANALEDNVRLYHVVKGKRVEFAGVNAKVETGKWHTLKLVAKGDRFQVHYDEKLLFEAHDETFKDAGKVGLWTKADSVIHFDDLTIDTEVGELPKAPKESKEKGEKDEDGDE